MDDFETLPIALREPFDLNLARHQAREALQLGYRVAVTATRGGESNHVFTAIPLSGGGVYLVATHDGSAGKRGNARTAVNDGFGNIARVFRQPGEPEVSRTRMGTLA